MSTLGLKFLIALVFSCAGTLAQGAEIKTLSSQPLEQRELWTGTCTHSLEGEIVEGDAARFQQAIDALPPQDHDDRNFRVCLSSPGGNLAEGLKLGQLIRNSFFATFVPAGAQCLSACAIAFMHGRVGYWEASVNHRMIHPTALLGFHAPKLNLPSVDGPVPVQMVDAAYSSATSIIAQLTLSAAQPSYDSKISVIPLTLLAAMLETPPDSFLYVDTMGKAFSWDIEIFPAGLVPPPGFDLKVGFYQLCFNGNYETQQQDGWEVGRVIELQDVQIFESSVFPKPTDMPQDHTFLSYGEMETWGCSYLYRQTTDDFVVRQYFEGNFFAEVWLPAVYMFGPDVKIMDIWPK